MTTRTPDALVAAIAALAADGHALVGIAAHLNKAGWRTPRGGQWQREQVRRVATKHGITVAYNLAKISAAKSRDAQVAPLPVPRTNAKVDTVTHASSESEDVRADRIAGIDQYTAESGVHRWLVEQAVTAFEDRLDALAWSIEAGPMEPDPCTGHDAAERDKLARKEARDAWAADCAEDSRLRNMIAGTDAVDAVEAIFCWYCDTALTMGAMRSIWETRRRAFEGQPTRVELRRRAAIRAKLYRQRDAKDHETLGELIVRAERAVRARLVAAEQAEADYHLLIGTPGLTELFDDLRDGLGKERGPTGRAMNAVQAAYRGLRYRRQQVNQYGTTVTARGAIEAAKAGSKSR